MIELQLDDTAAEPLFRQVYQQLKDLILEGHLTAGSRLPASRQLAAQTGTARITIIQAYEQLQEEGFLESRPGAGTFVARAVDRLPEAGAAFAPRLSQWGLRATAAGQAGRGERQRLEIDFGFGRSFPHIFPYDIWRQLLARYLSTDDVMLSRYGSPAGFLPLREALAAYLQRQRGVRCSPGQIAIVSGAQQAIDILTRLLIDPGDQIVVETPGYSDAYRLFQAQGAQLVPLAVDDYGLPVTTLPDGRRLRAVFVTPSHQFPQGGTLSLERRLALFDWARRNQALIVEDDYDSELRYDGRPHSALQGLDEGGHVIYLGTFSKVLFPALRLGYVVLPEQLVEAYSRAMALIDRGAPTLTQAAVADFIAEGHFERHLRRLRTAYGERRRVLVEALDEHLDGKVRYSRDPAGLHIMVHLQPEVDESRVVELAAAEGAGVYPGAGYFVQQPAPPSILLGYSGLNSEQIAEGVSRLAAAINRL